MGGEVIKIRRKLQVITLLFVLLVPVGLSQTLGARARSVGARARSVGARARSLDRSPLRYSPPTDTWRTECVDCPHGFYWLNDRSLRLDSAGNAHIAYGGDNLYYAWFNGTTWQTEVADGAANAGERASLALDLRDRPHIAYTVDWPGTYQLRYAFKDASGWHLQTVAISGQDFWHLSLGVSADDHVHIVYYQDNSLQYAYQDASGWHFQTVDSADSVGQFPSLALDASGYPHVSYYDEGGYHLRYAYRDAGGWHIQVVDAGGIGSSLALDEDGCAHISYLDRISNAARYARQEDCLDGMSWQLQTLDEVGYFSNEYTSLMLDSSSYPHVVYMSEIGGTLNYVFQDASGWHSQTLTSGLLDLSGVSLGLTAGGAAHIAFVGFPSLFEIHQVGSTWKQVQVDRSASIAGDASLAVDVQGRLHIAYFRDSDLVYAAQVPGGWQRQTVPGISDTYFHMALDGHGYPHFCHYDDGLSYTYWDAAGWHTTVVDADGVGWSSCSIAMDSQEYPHIVYLRLIPLIDEDYHYTYQDATGWHTAHLPDFGSHQLALDSQDHAHILFTTDTGLVYLQQDEGGWSETAVISGTFAYAALALDAEGYAHVSYYDTAGALKYSHQDANGWHTETVDSQGDPGRYTDIAVDAGGYPYISYQDMVYPFTGNLKLASLDGNGWHLQTVDTTYSTGFSTSIVLDEAGHPYIAYQNYATRDLMLAYPLTEVHYLPLVGGSE